MDAITAALQLATQVMSFVNNHEALVHVESLAQAQFELQKEKAKNYASDDALIEALEHKITILLQEVNNTFRVYASQGKQVAAADPVPPISGAV